MTYGKHISVFLMEGKSSGKIKCSMANWTGLAYKIPRIELESCKDIDAFNRSGVYFLFGVSDDPDKKVVYIGKASELFKRLNQHLSDPEKDYWSEAVVFTSSNESLGQTEIAYLENRFYNLALEAKRDCINNRVNPNSGNVTEEKVSELEEFIEYAKIIMGTLGYKLFEPLIQTKQSPSEETNTTEELFLFLKRKSAKSQRELNAEAVRTNEGFVVLQGSDIATESETLPESLLIKRKNTRISVDGKLEEDLLFSSPSYAAAFVTGNNENGLRVWKTKDGIALAQIETT